MNLSFYNEEVDRILWDTIGNDSFDELELSTIVNHVVDTIYMYNTELSKDRLKLIVFFLIGHKYKKYYTYDIEADLNKIITSNKNDNKSDIHTDSNNISHTDSDNISVDMLDFNTNDDIDIKPNSLSKNYINSEIISEEYDKIKLSSSNDLISHSHDYKYDIYKKTIIYCTKKTSGSNKKNTTIRTKISRMAQTKK